MNERIEAYLKLHYCRDYFNAYGETVEDDHYFMYREEFVGLIELIVRECAEWVNDNLGLVDEEARKDLLKHFGVEDEQAE
jgi:hypothetical protein